MRLRFDARPSPMSKPGDATRDVEQLPIAALRLLPVFHATVARARTAIVL
jgi:hypothetical protein